MQQELRPQPPPEPAAHRGVPADGPLNLQLVDLRSPGPLVIGRVSMEMDVFCKDMPAVSNCNAEMDRPEEAGGSEDACPTGSTRTPEGSGIESGSDSDDAEQGLSIPATSSQKRKDRPVRSGHTWQQRSRSFKVLRHRLRCCLHRCRQLQHKQDEVVTEKNHIAATCARVIAEVEAQCKKLATTAQLGVAVNSQKVDSSNWASRLHDFRQHTFAVQDMLLSAFQRSHDAAEALATALTCPISQDIIHRPLFAPDGQVYEEKMIRKWLHKSSTSPLTHQTMRPCELMRVRVVEQAVEVLWLLRGHERPAVEDKVLGPDELGTDALQEDSSQEPGLLEAVLARDEARALELLQCPELEEQLNEQVREEGPQEGATILHYALLNRMPLVAVAIAQHPAFDMPRAKMGSREHVTALHIAASLGFLDVCKVLLEEYGGSLLADKIKHSAILDLNDGDELYLQRNEHPLNLAKLHGHSDIFKVMKDALDAFLDEWEEERSVFE